MAEVFTNDAPGDFTDRTHVVISAPSQWGQQACDHLLHRAVAHGGKVTVIIPRRHQRFFETQRPSINAWREYQSVKDCLDDLRASGRPVEYCYDDHLNKLAAELIAQRQARTHLIAGYITSSVEDHYAHARYLIDFCDRVLIEKPVSRIYDDIKPDGPLSRLAERASAQNCILRSAEHYLFRPGVTNTWRSVVLDMRQVLPHHRKNEENRDDLVGFLSRYSACELHYEFHFEEFPGRDDPAERPGAYQDGALNPRVTDKGCIPSG